ncbi:uncharacterized protein LOC122063994 [Macadamia integrifolia]|uniref:uncharacterized protein LOC122063994 n=1 Tax=Macadamia integrifolia TaxID=60698 RepID=UPI001C4EBDD3|nr:uncharacterized protein LOC122063994 [Macadamia integrifolia]
MTNYCTCHFVVYLVSSYFLCSSVPQVWASGFSIAFLKKQSIATKGLAGADSGVEARGSSKSEEHKPTVTEKALLVVLEKFFERNEDPEKKLPNHIKMFDFTHKRPGCSMDDESAEKLEKMQRELSLEPEEMQQDNDVIDETFTKVMGRDRRGYVRMFGPGVTPKQVFDLEGLRAQRQGQHISELKLENSQLKEQISQQGVEMNEMKSQIAMLTQFMTSFQSSQG